MAIRILPQSTSEEKRVYLATPGGWAAFPRTAIAEALAYAQQNPIVPVVPTTTAVIAEKTEKLMTSRQLAERLHIGVKRIEGYARAGKLPHVRMGRSLRFNYRDVEAAVRGGALQNNITPNQEDTSSARPMRSAETL